MSNPSPRLEIADAIRVRHIQTPRASIVGFDETTGSAEAAERLRTLMFDSAPVLRQGEIVGRVDLADFGAGVSGALSAIMKPLAVGNFISADSPIGDLLSSFGGLPMLFVLDRRDISGVVTPSDLNKQPARTYFYLLLSAVEMGLSEALRRRYKGQWAAADLLAGDRRAAVLERYGRDVDLDIEADLISVFDLADLFTAVRRTPEIMSRLDVGTRRFKELAGRAVEVRHNVMHSSRVFYGPRRSPDTLAQLQQDLNKLADTLGRLPARIRRMPRPPTASRRAGPTPDELARLLGLPNGKSVRRYLRRTHTRPESLKWNRWGPLPKSVVEDVTRHFVAITPHRAVSTPS